MRQKIAFENFHFHPVIPIPQDVKVLDFSKEGESSEGYEFSIGRYNEKRPFIYTDDIFTKDLRYIHMGIDIGAPPGTTIYSFYNGKIHSVAYHQAPGDYGPTITCLYELSGQKLYALFGHLSEASIQKWKVGDPVHTGEKIAEVGDKSVNGGWPPHLHFQLSLEAPIGGDLPGVVSENDHARALEIYPDPRLVLGPIY
ncbi:MAG: peptidoglycan DD-metalloendopeptidase family protein [Bdellovibrionales bacterium]|nr:peptidoglycan DD-metalloendopeptidase family protein [Bdellovibrionales bacterium]